MLVEVSRGLILIVGVLVVVMSGFGIFAPRRLLDLVRGVMDQAWGMVFAVGIRLLLGAALVLAAPTARFPVVFEVLGWITLAAAVALPLIGLGRIRALISWMEQRSAALVRGWLVFGLAFGVFLVYGIG